MSNVSATEKQQRYILYLVGQRGYRGDSYIDASLGRAMGLSMRQRSGAGRVRDFVTDLDVSTASSIITALKG